MSSRCRNGRTERRPLLDSDRLASESLRRTSRSATWETDVYESYQLTTNLQLHASVTNLFNKQPPVDVKTYGTGSLLMPYDAAMHQDGAVARYFLVGIDYAF